MANQIRTMVIDVPLPESVVTRLKTEFPDIEFAFLGDPERATKLARADSYVHWNLSSETLQSAPSLRWYQSVAAGVESVLTPELRERNLIVTNNSGVHASNIAEHVLALMLAFARKLPELVLNQSKRVWKEDEPDDRMFDIFELRGQTLLVVGYGDIGQRLAQICSGIGMTVDAVKRISTGGRDQFTREIAPLPELKRLIVQADHVAICLPLTTETTRLFDASMFGLMNAGSFLYNIGRGRIVDTLALIEALNSGHLRGAGLDVTDPEPLPEDSPLWEMPGVIITAHTAGATPHYWERASEILTANIWRISRGERPLNLVDQQLGY